MDSSAYAKSLINNIRHRNGEQLAKQLALPLQQISDGSLPHKLKDFVNNIRGTNISADCSRVLKGDDVSSLASLRLEAFISVVDGDYVTAYRIVCNAYNAVLELFNAKDEDTTWIIPVLVRVSNDLRIVADMADGQERDANNKYLRESLNYLTKGFTAVARDRTGSKKLAIFAVTNVMFKIYFKANTLQLCGKLINVVEGPGGTMSNLRVFPVCDVVMYKYYIGRLKMFEDRYEEARDCLRFALKFCPARCVKNRQRILASLVPVEMCLGVMPAQKVCAVYGLGEFTALAEAAVRGDVGSFERTLQRHQASFIRIGVYLVLEQVKMLAYRNLFRRIYLLAGSTRLNLYSFEAALKWMGEEEMDVDEIECILANLIYQGKIKGYISHQKRFLIVSKTGPFPKTAVVNMATK